MEVADPQHPTGNLHWVAVAHDGGDDLVAQLES